MYLIRLIIVGETGVGKTSLLIRFNEDNFILDQKTTIGVDYKAKEISIGEDSVKLQIWDTAGQERFRAMTSAFYSKAQGVVVTFDVSQRDSFTALENWLRDIKQLAPPHCSILLCANKVDLAPDLWRVRKEEYESYAREIGVPLFECSASSGLNVNPMFTELAKQILLSHRSELTKVDSDATGQTGGSIILAEFAERQRKEKKQKSCCKS
eukprot:gene10823-11795_t